MDVCFLLCIILASTTEAQYKTSATTIPEMFLTTANTTPSTANTITAAALSTANTTTPATTLSTANTTTPATTLSTANTTTLSTANTTTPATTLPTANTTTPATIIPDTTTSTTSTTLFPTTSTTSTTLSPTASTTTPAPSPSIPATTTTPATTLSPTASTTTTTTTTPATTLSTATTTTTTTTTTPATTLSTATTTTPATTLSTANTTTTTTTTPATTLSTATTTTTTTTTTPATTLSTATTTTPATTLSTATTTTTTTTTTPATTLSTATTTTTTTTTTTPATTLSTATTTTTTTTTTPATTLSTANTTTPTTANTTTLSPTASTTTTTTTPATTLSTANTTTPVTTLSTANTTTPTTANTTTLSPTASTTTTTPATTLSTANTTRPPLVCENGGKLSDGVCLCGDDWGGDTCSEANFCKAVILEGLKFPRTPVSWFSYSEEVCAEGTSAAGKPQGATRCSNNNGLLGFQKPQLLRCDQTLSDILQNLTTVGNPEMLATSAQILTSRPEELTTEDVTAAAEIANTLLLSPNATESVRMSAIATVSQLLNASTLDNAEENNATLSLTLTLDQLSLSLSSDLRTSRSQMVQPNLVLQSTQVAAADTQGVQFTSLTGTSGNFVPDRIQLNTNTSTVVVENGFKADALIYIKFPPDAADRNQKQSHISVGFVLYQNDRFFRSALYKRRHTTIRVLSASVKGQRHRVVPQHVEMMFTPTLKDGTSLYDFACVSWNYTLEDWSTAGCSKENASDGAMRCFCNHTTNFAALQTFIEIYKYAEDLGLISILGSSVSVLGLVVTVISVIKDKKSLQKNPEVKVALLSICSSLLSFIISFLSGAVQSEKADDKFPIVTQSNDIPSTDEHKEPDRMSCTLVAILLHFSLLATFMWISLYGHLMVKLQKDSRPPQYWTKLSFTLGWGLPAVVVGITLAVTYRPDNPLAYRQEEFCWLAALDKNKHFDFGKPMFWGFILPSTLILIYNFIILTRISLRTCRKRPCPSSSSFPMAVLVGLSFAFGYIILNTTDDTVFRVLFGISGITLGFLFFILFTATTPSFRDSVSGSVKYVSSVKMPPVNIKLSSNKKYNLQRPKEKTTSQDSYRSLSEDTYVTTQL
ncbi:adhesion G-protein coupled receptor G7-like [Paralichthys olivaceus]|uniref:adhesion G-protein coupled receptor G7-like n=1 Tax=Paralichthys olivaceus TaxID=8255 RepID=UPI003751252E